MHRLDADKFDSPYYPPRARWYSAVFRPLFKLRRLLHLEKIHLPAGFSLQQLGLGLLVPGYAFFANGRRILGWTFMGVYGASAALFIVALGYQAGSIGFGLMISAHASSIIFLEGQWLRAHDDFGPRLLLALLTVLLVWLAIYSPFLGLVQRHGITPLRVRGHVVIVQRLASPAFIRRGDWIMYSLQEQYAGDAHRGGGAVRLDAGYSYGPVLAGAGDHVVFSTNTFLVNGVAHPSLPYMPGSGELIVPEKHWFVWPELAITGHGAVAEARLTGMMLQLATVSQVEYIGKPFKHWFWRRQIFL